VSFPGAGDEILCDASWNGGDDDRDVSLSDDGFSSFVSRVPVLSPGLFLYDWTFLP
jgi:hypothetical protein